MKLKKTSLSETVYLELTRRIVNGQIPAGEALTEEQLAAECKVSRTPVREALRRLAEEGLGELLPRRGFRVRTGDTGAFRELIECRARIEPLALELALPVLPPEFLTELEKRFETADPAQSLAADEEFHAGIARHCPNRPLGEIVLRLLKQTAPFRHLRNYGGEGERARAERRELIAAIRTGNPANACRLLAEHIRRALP